MKTIRSASRAMIIAKNKLLSVTMRNAQGEFFILPGGGQHHGESLKEAVKRECKEELGVEIKVGRLIYSREYIGKNHDFNPKHKDFHQIEHVFECSVLDDASIGKGLEKDKRQIGYEWIPLDSLEAYNFLPRFIIQFIKENKLEFQNPYLGDVN